MPEVYATDLQLTPIASKPRQAFLDSVRSWVGARWPHDRKWFSVETASGFKTAEGSVLRWEPFIDGDRTLLEFTWRHQDRDDPQITWSTQATFYSTTPHHYRIALRVSNTGPETGTGNELLTTRPRLVTHLLDAFKARCDGYSLKIDPPRIDADTVQDFVRYTLFDSTRKHPVLVLSPVGDNIYACAPDAVGRDYLSLAEVVALDKPSTTFGLTEEIGSRALSCFNGAMRVYMPGLRQDGNPLNHPLLFANRLGESAGRVRLARLLSLRAATRYRGNPQINVLRDERAIASDARLRTLVTSLDAVRESATRENAEVLEIAEAIERENASLKAANAALREELLGAEHKIAGLRYQLTERRKADGEEPEEEEYLPEDVHEAVEMAQELYTDHLLVLDSALKSARESPYRKPAEVWQALLALQGVAESRMQGPLGKGFRDLFKDQNLEYRASISETSSRRIRDQYRFHQDGKEYTCEEHLCLGSGSYDPAKCLRIYFTTAHPHEERIVIGHVGRHLDVITTT